MNKRSIAPLLGLAVSAMTGSAFASTIGLPGDTFATTWDTFPFPSSIAFSNDAPDTSTGQVNATLSSTMTAGSVTGSGARLYSGSGATPNPYALSVNGTTTIPVDDFGIVLKFSSPAGATPSTPEAIAAAQVAAASHFNVSLAGQGAGLLTYLGYTTESSTFFIFQWTWENLALTSGENFDFTITSPAGHVSLDAVQLVPEPGSAVLGALGAGLLAIRRRRK